MSAVIRCPECNAALRLKQLGAKIRCPKCEHVFRHTPEEEQETLPRSKATTSAKQANSLTRDRQAAPDEDRDDEEERAPRKQVERAESDDDRPRPKKKKKAKKSDNGGMVVLLVVGGVVLFLLLVGGAVGGFFLFIHKSDSGSTSNSSASSGSGSGGTPGAPVNNAKLAENLSRVQVGMTKSEVEQLIGGPGKKLGPTDTGLGVKSAESWEYDNGSSIYLIVHWEAQGVVIGKKYVVGPNYPGAVKPGSGGTPGTPVNNAKLTIANANKLKAGMTKSEIEQLLGGPGKKLGPTDTGAGLKSAETWEYDNGTSIYLLVYWDAQGVIITSRLESGPFYPGAKKR